MYVETSWWRETRLKGRNQKQERRRDGETEGGRQRRKAGGLVILRDFFSRRNLRLGEMAYVESREVT